MNKKDKSDKNTMDMIIHDAVFTSLSNMKLPNIGRNFTDMKIHDLWHASIDRLWDYEDKNPGYISSKVSLYSKGKVVLISKDFNAGLFFKNPKTYLLTDGDATIRVYFKPDSEPFGRPLDNI